jgi:DNA-directed RNA polymerase specialized sigma24 family protein
MAERRRPRPIAPEERAQILALAQQGVSYREIAQAFDRPQGTINRAISDAILEGSVQRRNLRQDTRRE